MTDDLVATAARAAARQLSEQYGPRLEVDVEVALNSSGQAKPPPQYIDPIELASFIVAVASFAYQVYSDRKNQGHKPDKEQVTRMARIEQRKYRELTRADEKVVEITTAEVFKVADGQDG